MREVHNLDEEECGAGRFVTWTWYCIFVAPTIAFIAQGFAIRNEGIVAGINEFHFIYSRMFGGRVYTEAINYLWSLDDKVLV